MKSDERSISAIAAQAHNAEADKRTLQKKLAASERRVQRRATYGQKTEGKYNGRNNMTPADEADLNGEEVPESTFDVSDEEFSEVMDGINVIRKKMQMRQIAIYRNNSYYLGSVKSAKRFARLASLTQSAKNCKRNVQKYFHDILNRVMVTAKEELTSILPHKWVEPVTIPLVY